MLEAVEVEILPVAEDEVLMVTPIIAEVSAEDMVVGLEIAEESFTSELGVLKVTSRESSQHNSGGSSGRSEARRT